MAISELIVNRVHRVFPFEEIETRQDTLSNKEIGANGS